MIKTVKTLFKLTWVWYILCFISMISRGYLTGILFCTAVIWNAVCDILIALPVKFYLGKKGKMSPEQLVEYISLKKLNMSSLKARIPCFLVGMVMTGDVSAVFAIIAMSTIITEGVVLFIMSHTKIDSYDASAVSDGTKNPSPKVEEKSAPAHDPKNDAKMLQEERERGKILGSLIGGAAGDALGYTVEFSRYSGIVQRYGKGGIESYEIDRQRGKAIISDDTQMTLFTAEALLKSDGDYVDNIYHSYLNWLETQRTSFDGRGEHPESTLMNRRELFSLRAPGNTCLSALSSGIMGTVTNPINSSKGCGGVMRVAPIAFLNSMDADECDKLAAKAAAITHGHPLGYLPAALLVHIVHKAIYEEDEKRSLRNIIDESMIEFEESFSGAPYLDDLMALVRKAVLLSENKESDVQNIRALGEGWVAEETLAIAVYCALRYPKDFSKALVASVNHDGDSDSTGAVTGNILGAYLGEEKIDKKWEDSLELYDVIRDFAHRLRK